ncbi:hypothetical protein CANINC_003927 [Pichia inconspicua]|uniref:CFEM domain-containing protein n=1 Tax=Pichia inconspicua TaxID=52247 RepID=A0A4T0WXJ5_9ASCO|nr:hypothetical protein CANINC_003927 [[Candida] inconspicua]
MLSYVSLAVLLSAYVAPSLATPPACLLACAADVVKSSSTCNKLDDIKCVCSSEASALKSCLDTRCPDGLSGTAYSAFEGICGGFNVDIDSQPSSSSASSSATSSSAEPTTSSAESTSSSAEPTTSSVEPTTSSAEPTTSSAEPTTSSVEPTTSSAEPTTTSVKPTTTSVKPTTSSSSAEPTTLSSSVKPSSTVTEISTQTNIAGSVQYNALLGAVAIAAANLI